MKHSEGIFWGRKNLKLYYQCWLPAEEPGVILLIVHGLAEHSGRYQNLVNYFVAKGFAIYGLDHQGHGRSDGLRGYVERFSDYLDDLETFFNLVCAKHGSARIFLIGHSMGGTIAIAYAVHHQDKLGGLIVSGASLKIGASLQLIIAARILSRLLPKMGISILDASAISRDKAVVAAYVNDPLVYRGKIRARLAVELIKTIQKLWSQVPKINLPILIMHGAADRLADPEGSRMLYARVSSKDKTLKLYHDLYHEIFNEPEHKQVLADMESWLSTRL